MSSGSKLCGGLIYGVIKSNVDFLKLEYFSNSTSLKLNILFRFTIVSLLYSASVSQKNHKHPYHIFQ